MKVELIPAAPSRGPTRPGPSGKELCARVGGLRGGGRVPGGDLGAWPVSEARVGRGDGDGGGAVGSRNRLWLTP